MTAHTKCFVAAICRLVRSDFNIISPQTFTVRFEEQIDQSTTVKFVYFHWIGKQIPFTMKGRYGIVHGSVRKCFEVELIRCVYAPQSICIGLPSQRDGDNFSNVCIIHAIITERPLPHSDGLMEGNFL